MSFQERVQPWMMACFGAEIAADKLERADRFIEEALELCQTAPGFSIGRAHALVDYVFNRPQGDVNQEVGGVMVTLAAFCLAFDLDMDEAAETELARVWTKVEQIRAKQAAKPKGSALPVAASHTNPGPPPPTPGPGPKPAAEETSQPVEAAPRTDAHFQETLCWLYGFAAGHADDGVRKSAARQIQNLEDYLIYRREERAELDPRVTWSSDYEAFERLTGQLEALKGEHEALIKAIDDFADTRVAKERIRDIMVTLDAAIRTCGQLGLPF